MNPKAYENIMITLVFFFISQQNQYTAIATVSRFMSAYILFFTRNARFTISIAYTL